MYVTGDSSKLSQLLSVASSSAISCPQFNEAAAAAAAAASTSTSYHPTMSGAFASNTAPSYLPTSTSTSTPSLPSAGYPSSAAIPSLNSSPAAFSSSSGGPAVSFAKPSAKSSRSKSSSYLSSSSTSSSKRSSSSSSSSSSSLSKASSVPRDLSVREESVGRPRCEHFYLSNPSIFKNTRTALCRDACGIRAAQNGKEAKVRLCNECGIWENYKYVVWVPRVVWRLGCRVLLHLALPIVTPPSAASPPSSLPLIHFCCNYLRSCFSATSTATRVSAPVRTVPPPLRASGRRARRRTGTS